MTEPAPQALRYPPPYTLRCDVALFPTLISASDAGRMGLDVGGGFAGQRVLWIIMARYDDAWYGHEQAFYPKPDASADLYREVGYAVSASILPHALVFGRLWVDGQDSAPIDLGKPYGFPKVKASVTLDNTRTHVHMDTRAHDDVLARLDAVPVAWLPAWLVARLAGATVYFPTTRLRATMRVGKLADARLLRVTDCSYPYFQRLGVTSWPRVGLWLRGTELHLNQPQAITR